MQHKSEAAARATPSHRGLQQASTAMQRFGIRRRTYTMPALRIGQRPSSPDQEQRMSASRRTMQQTSEKAAVVTAPYSLVQLQRTGTSHRTRPSSPD